MNKYKIEKDSIQETLMIPLIGRKVCSDHFPELFSDPEADRILSMLDCDLVGKLRKMETAPGLFGALEVAQRQYDLGYEVRDYLKDHPVAAVRCSMRPGCFTISENLTYRSFLPPCRRDSRVRFWYSTAATAGAPG